MMEKLMASVSENIRKYNVHWATTTGVTLSGHLNGQEDVWTAKKSIHQFYRTSSSIAAATTNMLWETTLISCCGRRRRRGWSICSSVLDSSANSNIEMESLRKRKEIDGKLIDSSTSWTPYL